jgi:hypothetical protein
MSKYEYHPPEGMIAEIFKSLFDKLYRAQQDHYESWAKEMCRIVLPSNYFDIVCENEGSPEKIPSYIRDYTDERGVFKVFPDRTEFWWEGKMVGYPYKGYTYSTK